MADVISKLGSPYILYWTLALRLQATFPPFPTKVGHLIKMPAEIVQLHSHSTSSPFTNIEQLVHEGLSHPLGEKNLPTILLYDERGLKLYDKITTQAAEYYPFQAEEQILKRSADDIVRMMHGSISGPVADEVVLELGAGFVF